MVSSPDDLSRLVELYATLSKLRLFATDATIAAASGILENIIQTYHGPKIDVSKTATFPRDKVDILRSFTEAARRELQS